jgi:hypothetical protein
MRGKSVCSNAPTGGTRDVDGKRGARRPNRRRLTAGAARGENRPDSRSGAAEVAAMAWRVEGTYFETCSCEVVCPSRVT